MSSVYLPDEVLELIFSQVYDKAASPTPASQSTFASLCLVSKQYLPIAQSHLYYRPILPTRASWSQANDLTVSLFSGNGRLVRSLDGIGDYFSDVASRTPFADKHKVCKRMPPLYLALLSACPRLAVVALHFSSTQEVNEVLEAIEPSLPTLETVKLLGPWTCGWCDRLDGELVQETLRRPSLQGIKRLVLDDIDIDWTSRLDGIISIPLESLRVRDPPMEPFRLKGVLLRDRSALRHLSLDTDEIDADSFTNRLNSLSPDVLRLTIQCADYYRPILEEYHERLRSSIPISEFNSLTSLTHLKLECFQGPSSALLDMLCESSPNLASIDFTTCRWIASPTSSDPSSETISEPNRIFPEVEILVTLQHFDHLRYILSRLSTYDRLECLPDSRSRNARTQR